MRTSNAHTFHDQTTKEHVQEPSTVTRNKSGSPPLDAQRVDPHSQPSTPPTQSKSDQEETEALSGTNEVTSACNGIALCVKCFSAKVS